MHLKILFYRCIIFKVFNLAEMLRASEVVNEDKIAHYVLELCPTLQITAYRSLTHTPHDIMAASKLRASINSTSGSDHTEERQLPLSNWP